MAVRLKVLQLTGSTVTLRKGGGEGVENSISLHPFLQTSLEGSGVGQPTGDGTSNDIMIISGYISYFLGCHHDSTVPIVLKEKAIFIHLIQYISYTILAYPHC